MIGQLVAQTLRISTPYVFASVGGGLSERAGVVNIALEGILLSGAFAYAAATLATGSGVAGLCAALVVGAALGGLHALLVLALRGDAIISGLAINLLAAGGTRFLLKLLYGSSANSPRVEGISSTSLFIAVAALVVLLAHGLYQRTALGLRMRAAGERPEALESVGVDVLRLRAASVVVGGAVCALGGAWLAADQHQFTSGMSAGRGFIAIAALIFGRWRPLGAALACGLFGLAETLQIQLQTTGLDLPNQLVQALPYALTLVVLAVWAGRARAPAALGRSYEPSR